MKRAWQMADPGTLEPVATQHSLQDFRIRVRNLAEGVWANQRVDVDHVNAPFGKIRAAFFHRIFSKCSPRTPMTSSARSFARPVHIVRSEPQSSRGGPRV